MGRINDSSPKIKRNYLFLKPTNMYVKECENKVLGESIYEICLMQFVGRIFNNGRFVKRNNHNMVNYITK